MPRKNATDNQQAMAILRDGKLEQGYEEPKLVSSLNRGGLWNITKCAQNIFLKTECHFKRPSHSKLKSANSCWQTQIGVCERHKNRRQTRLQTVGVK